MSSDGESAQLRHDIQVEKAKIRNEKNRLRLLLSQGRQNLDVAEGADNRAPCGSVGSVEHFQDQPHQQANKCDRIGKVADWIGVNQFGDRNRRNDRYSNHYSSGAGGSEYDYVHDDDESTFQLVDTTKPHRSMIQRSARTRQQHFVYRKIIQKEEERRKQATCEQNQKIKRIIAKEQQRAFKQWQKRGGGNRGQGRDRGWYSRWDKRSLKDLPASIVVRPQWQLLEEMDFLRLAKLTLPNVDPGKDINGHRYGRLYFYDKCFDKVTVKTERPLQHCGGTFYNVTTTEDPVIQQLAREDAGNVFATDVILATLMAATRSVHSWDVVAYRVGDKLFFDKRKTTDFSNPVDGLTVNETSAFAPQRDDTSSINHPRNLATEALYVNQNFRRMVLKRNEDSYNYDHANIPFDDGEEGADSCVAYKYRLWLLGEMANGKEIRLVCRTEQDGVMLAPNGEIQTITIKALNEWDPKLSGGVDWRSRLDTQKGAVLATELQNNSCKLAKWTLQALLAGSDVMKFGYVSRVNARNSADHMILGTQQSKPEEFASNIALSLDNAWGIVRCIVDQCMEQPAGKYLLFKEPNKPCISLYSLPEGALESSDDSEDSCSEEHPRDDDV